MKKVRDRLVQDAFEEYCRMIKDGYSVKFARRTTFEIYELVPEEKNVVNKLILTQIENKQEEETA